MTCRKGDCNNTGECDNEDIDPFVAAMSAEDYAAEFPGLTGSRIYHADCDCDDDVDYDDVDAFIACLGGDHPECETADCGGDAPGGDPPELDPETVARLFSANLSEPRLATFIQIAEVLANGDSPRAEFWTAVLEYLEE